jgi:hypothetical protein
VVEPAYRLSVARVLVPVTRSIAKGILQPSVRDDYQSVIANIITRAQHH